MVNVSDLESFFGLCSTACEYAVIMLKMAVEHSSLDLGLVWLDLK
jgi:hypothetical protein